jgi:hypothetical protein
MGLVSIKVGVSLAKMPAKAYGMIRIVGSDPDGSD